MGDGSQHNGAQFYLKIDNHNQIDYLLLADLVVRMKLPNSPHAVLNTCQYTIWSNVCA